jgi:hypothetical protein
VEAFKPVSVYEVSDPETKPICVYVPEAEVQRYILYELGVPPEEGALHNMAILPEDWAAAVTFVGMPGTRVVPSSSVGHPVNKIITNINGTPNIPESNNLRFITVPPKREKD